MALHDVDRNSEDRGTPAPNHTDKVIDGAHKAHGTNSVNYVSDATPSYSGGTNTGSVGGGNPIRYGYKKLVSNVSFTLVNDGSTLTTGSIAHGLNYVPVVELLFENASLTIAGGGGSVTGATVPGPFFAGADIGSDVSGVVSFTSWIYAFADATNIYVNMLNATGSPITLHPTLLVYQVG